MRRQRNYLQRLFLLTSPCGEVASTKNQDGGLFRVHKGAGSESKGGSSYCDKVSYRRVNVDTRLWRLECDD